MSKHALKATAGLNLGFIQFGLETNIAEWGGQPPPNPEEEFCLINEIRQLRYEMRCISDRLAVIEKDVPFLIRSQAKDIAGLRRLFVQADQAARNFHLKTGVICLPNHNKPFDLDRLSVFGTSTTGKYCEFPGCYNRSGTEDYCRSHRWFNVFNALQPDCKEPGCINKALTGEEYCQSHKPVNELSGFPKLFRRKNDCYERALSDGYSRSHTQSYLTKNALWLGCKEPGCHNIPLTGEEYCRLHKLDSWFSAFSPYKKT